MFSHLLLATCLFAGFDTEKVITPDLSQIKDEKIWSVINGDFDLATEQGRKVVRLRPKIDPSKPSNIGLALVEGLAFAEGAIEVDLRGQGKVGRCFLGVTFSAVDGNTFEAVYFRPFNFSREPKSFRDHGVQYVSWPEHTWEKLRAETPGVYEAAVKPIPDPNGWFHARVEVTKQKVRVWIDGAKEPCLVVDRRSGRDKGKVGLWVDSREGTFSNLKIISAK
jgi:hypothetical protein